MVLNSRTASGKLPERILLAVLGIAIATVLAEIGLRTVDFIRNALQASDRKSAYVIHGAYEKKDVYGPALDRFAQMRYSCFLGYFPLENYRGNGYVSNKYGFRYVDDFPVKKPENEVRVFVTGGSTAWGWGVRQEDLYATIAENALQDRYPDKKIRVVAAGVHAYLSTHEKILVLNKIKDFEPDVVIMLSGYNDIWAGYAGVKPLDDTWDFLEAARVLVKHNRYYSLGEGNTGNKIYPPRYGDYLFKTHYAFERFLYRLKSRKSLEESIACQQIDSNIIFENLRDNITVVADASKRNNFTFIFYLQPSLFNTKKSLSPPEVSFRDSADVVYVNFPEYNRRLYDIFRRRLPLLAQEEGFVFVDGDEAFAHESRTVFTDQVHLGDRGNRLIANHMTGIVTGLMESDSVKYR